MKDYVSPEDYPVAYVLNAAKEDGQAQDDMQASVREAVTFVLDLVEHSRAFDEVLPRGYSVHKVRGRKAKDKGVIKPRVELRHQPVVSSRPVNH